MGSAGEEPTGDQALVLGIDPVRSEAIVLRRRGRQVTPCVVRPLEDGKPIFGDVVRLKPNPGFPPLCDIETVLTHPDPPPMPSHRPGPPMVTNEAYRRGWEQVFGARPPACEEPN